MEENERDDGLAGPDEAVAWFEEYIPIGVAALTLILFGCLFFIILRGCSFGPLDEAAGLLPGDDNIVTEAVSGVTDGVSDVVAGDVDAIDEGDDAGSSDDPETSEDDTTAIVPTVAFDSDDSAGLDEEDAGAIGQLDDSSDAMDEQNGVETEEPAPVRTKAPDLEDTVTAEDPEEPEGDTTVIQSESGDGTGEAAGGSKEGEDGASDDEALPPTFTPEAATTEDESSDASGEDAASTPEPEAVATEEPVVEEPTAEAEAEPVTQSVVDILTAQSNTGALVGAVGAAGLGDGLNADGPFTIFAPTDQAFAELPDGALAAITSDQSVLQTLLTHHVVEGTVVFGDSVASAEVNTLAGLPLQISTQEDGSIQVGNAFIEAEPIAASNGVVYLVNRVILPPNETAPPRIDGSGVPTFEGTFLTVVGVAEPNVRLILELNGELFGETVVAQDGTWLVPNDISPGEYEIVAYTLSDAGIPLGVSNSVFLTVK